MLFFWWLPSNSDFLCSQECKSLQLLDLSNNKIGEEEALEVQELNYTCCPKMIVRVSNFGEVNVFWPLVKKLSYDC